MQDRGAVYISNTGQGLRRSVISQLRKGTPPKGLSAAWGTSWALDEQFCDCHRSERMESCLLDIVPCGQKAAWTL